MKYTCVYADDAGESHYEDLEDELTVRDYAPPSPPFSSPPRRRPPASPSPGSRPAGTATGTRPRGGSTSSSSRVRSRARRATGTTGATARGARFCSRTRPARVIAPGWWATKTCWPPWCICRTDVDQTSLSHPSDWWGRSVADTSRRDVLGTCVLSGVAVQPAEAASVDPGRQPAVVGDFSRSSEARKGVLQKRFGVTSIPRTGARGDGPVPVVRRRLFPRHRRAHRAAAGYGVRTQAPT